MAERTVINRYAERGNIDGNVLNMYINRYLCGELTHLDSYSAPPYIKSEQIARLTKNFFLKQLFIARYLILSGRNRSSS